MIGRSLSCLPENRFLFYESFFPEEINSFEGIDGIIYNTKMKPPKVVLDTNVLVSALRSKQGASHRLLMLLDSGRYVPVVSVPLVLEYESAAKKLVGPTRLSGRDVEAVIDYLCAQAQCAEIYYLWRPFLKDAKDDMVLDAAVASDCSHRGTL